MHEVNRKFYTQTTYHYSYLYLTELAWLILQNCFLYFSCILQNPRIDELLNDAPLELAYNSYLVIHGKHLFPMITQLYSSLSTATFTYSDNIFPQNPSEADIQRKKRFCACRNIVFYLYPGLKRREQYPLPACVYREDNFSYTDISAVE